MQQFILHKQPILNPFDRKGQMVGKRDMNVIAQRRRELSFRIADDILSYFYMLLRQCLQDLFELFIRRARQRSFPLYS